MSGDDNQQQREQPQDIDGALRDLGWIVVIVSVAVVAGLLALAVWLLS